jgi:hypothetical protein
VTELLQRELSRIADRAPTADVPADTWQQGRRSVRRTRIGAVAAAVAVVAVVAGLVSWLPQRGSTPVAEGALGVPESVRIPGYKELTPTSDLAVGTQAVALKSLDHEPVVVDAEDGTYRALSLPGFEGRRGVLGLAPDGRRLVWGWSTGQDSRDGIGIRVVDLATGEWESYDLRDAKGGTFVYAFSWSPDGRWLVWTAVEPGADQPTGVAAGRIGPDGTSVRVPLPRSNAQTTVLAVGDDGVVLVATPDQVLHWDGEVIDRTDRAGDRAPVAVTARDGVVVEATTDDFDVAVDYRLTSGADIPEWKGKMVALLGQLDDGTVVVLLGGTMEERLSSTPPALRLQLLDPLTGEVTSVGTFEGDVTDVAVGLMTTKRPTVSESVGDEPGWGPDTSLLIGLGVAGVLSVLAGLRWLWRRYRAAKYAS